MAALAWVPLGSTSGLLWPIHTGTVKWKQAPSPCSDTTQIRPPCTSLIRRHTERPVSYTHLTLPTKRIV